MEDDTEGSEPEIAERVERALDAWRDLLTEEELAEARRMLTFLATTHPQLSNWIEEQRPPAVPERSGTRVKKSAADLLSGAARAKARGGRRG